MGSDDTKTIRVEACKLGSFDSKCVNSIVEVKGTLVEDRIDEAYLQNWEKQLSAQTGKDYLSFYHVDAASYDIKE